MLVSHWFWFKECSRNLTNLSYIERFFISHLFMNSYVLIEDLYILSTVACVHHRENYNHLSDNGRMQWLNGKRWDNIQVLDHDKGFSRIIEHRVRPSVQHNLTLLYWLIVHVISTRMNIAYYCDALSLNFDLRKSWWNSWLTQGIQKSWKIVKSLGMWYCVLEKSVQLSKILVRPLQTSFQKTEIVII